MATSKMNYGASKKERSPKKQPNPSRLRRPPTTRSTNAVIAPDRSRKGATHDGSVVPPSQPASDGSVPSSQIPTKFVPLIETEDSMKDFQSSDVVFVGVSTKSRRQATISDLFGRGGEAPRPTPSCSKTDAIKSPSKDAKIFKSPRKKRSSKKVVSKKIDNPHAVKAHPVTEKTKPRSPEPSSSQTIIVLEPDEVSTPSCPLCQMPFALLTEKETAESHTAVCMDTPFNSQTECDLGAACMNRNPGHYRNFRHSAKARLLSGVGQIEGDKGDPSESTDSGISSAESTPLDCLKEAKAGAGKRRLSSGGAGKCLDLDQHRAKKSKGSSASTIHSQKYFSPIPEENANSSFALGSKTAADNMMEGEGVNLIEEADIGEGGKGNKERSNSASVVSPVHILKKDARPTVIPGKISSGGNAVLEDVNQVEDANPSGAREENGLEHSDIASLVPCSDAAARLQGECKETLDSVSSSVNADASQEENSPMDVSVCSEGEEASDIELQETAGDNLRDFTSSSSSNEDDDDDKDEEVIDVDLSNMNDDDDDDDELLAAMPMTTDPSEASSSASPFTSPSKQANAAPATQQLSLLNFFQPVNQKCGASRTERFASGEGPFVRGRKKGLALLKQRTSVSTDTQSHQESKVTLKKSMSDVSPTATAPLRDLSLPRSASEILPGTSGYGGRPGRKGSTGNSWRTAGQTDTGSGRGRGGWGGRGGNDVWTRGGGDQACPFYKKIPDTGFTVDAFRYGTIPGCTAYFLTHFHYDHFGGLTKNFSHLLYCSKVTGNLVRKRIGVAEQHIKCLPLDSPCVVDGVEVTLIEANHCPGAVLLLFRLRSGRTVLHTGDFRADPSMETHPALAGTHIHSLYLDTTYCDPSYAFPPQQEVVSFAVSLVRKAVEENPKVLVVCGAYTIGKERIFAAIAEMLDCKIGVMSDKKAVLQCLEDAGLMARITTRLEEARVHVLPMGKLRGQQLEEHLSRFQQFSGLLAFEPTGWTFSKKALSLEHIRPKYSRNGIVVYGVPYSEHSSFLELKRFVQFTKPDKILPTVNNGSAASRRKMETFFHQWLSEANAFKKPSPSKQTSLAAWRK